jgi:hypothetical protein
MARKVVDKTESMGTLSLYYRPPSKQTLKILERAHQGHQQSHVHQKMIFPTIFGKLKIKTYQK